MIVPVNALACGYNHNVLHAGTDGAGVPHYLVTLIAATCSWVERLSAKCCHAPRCAAVHVCVCPRFVLVDMHAYSSGAYSYRASEIRINNYVLQCMALYLIGVVSPSEPHMCE